MSTTIDERVVEMRFDNKQFKEAAGESLNIIEKLGQVIDKSTTADNVGKIAKSIDGINFGNAISGIDSLADRFSALGIVGMRVIENITDGLMGKFSSAINSMTSSIISGGINRAMNIENARFQLQGIIDDTKAVEAGFKDAGEMVSYVMQQAGDSVDGTAYSYDVAAKAASMFAASGVKAGTQMEQSLKAIAGVSATFNADYQDISNIFTTIAGQGKVMADQLNQLSFRGMNAAASIADYFNQVKKDPSIASEEVAKAVKSFSKSTTTTEAEIRELVTKGKINFSIFSEAMAVTFGDHAKDANKTFNGSMANIRAALARTGEMFIAPLIKEEGSFVRLFNSIRKKVNEFNGELKPLAASITTFVNRTVKQLSREIDNIHVATLAHALVIALQGVGNILKGIWSVLRPIGQAFADVFGIKTYKSVLDFAIAFRNATDNLGLSKEAANGLRIVVTALLTPIKGLLTILGKIITVGLRVAGVFGNMAEGLLEMVSGVSHLKLPFEQFMTAAQKSRALTALSTIMQNLGQAFTNLKMLAMQAALEVTSAIGELIGNSHLVNGFTDIINNAGSYLAEGFVSILEKIASIKLDVPKTLTELFESFGGLGEKLSGVFNVIKSGAAGVIGVLMNIGSAMKEAIVPTDSLVKNAADRYKKISGEMVAGLDFSTRIKGTINQILGILNTGLLGGVLLQLTKFFKSFNKHSQKITNSVCGVLNSVRDTLKTYQTTLKAEAIRKIAISIGILAGSLLVLSLIPEDKLQNAVAALTAVGIGLGIFAKSVSGMKINSTDMLSMIFIAAGIGILAEALKSLSEVGDLNKIGQGFVGIALSMLVLVAALAEISRIDTSNTDMIKTSVYLLVIAFAIGKIAKALVVLAGIDFMAMLGGLLGVGIALFGMTKFLDSVGDEKLNVKSIGSVVLFAFALRILASAIKVFGEMKLESMVQGLAGFSTALILLAGAMKYLDQTDPKSMLAAGAGMMLMVTGLTALVIPISILGAIPLPMLAQGLLAVCVALAAMAIVMKTAGNAASSLGAGGGMLLMAIALNLLVIPITILGALPLELVAQGLGAILAALLGFAVIGAIATPAAIGLMALGTSLMMVSGAFFIFSAGVGLLGAGLVSLAAGLVAISAVSTSASENIVNALTIILTGLATMLPTIATYLAEAFITFAETVLNGIDRIFPLLAQTLTTLIIDCIAVLTSTIPAIVEGALLIVDAVLQALVAYGPTIVDYLMTFLVDLFNKLAERTPELVSAISNFLGALVGSIVEAINGIDATSIIEAVSAAKTVAIFLGVLASFSVLTGPALAGVIGFGIVAAELAGVIAALGKLSEAIPGLTNLLGSGGDLLGAIGTAIGQFIGGIVGGAAEGISSSLPSIGTNLSSFMENAQKFIDGSAAIDPAMLGGVESLVGAMLMLTGAEIVDALTSWLTGGSSLEQFGQDLESFAPHFRAFADEMDGVDPEVVTASANAAKALAEMAKSIPNSGGKIADWLGDNTLSSFGKELADFGPYFASYAESVAGISVEDVEASASAAQMLSDLANGLPNSGGVLADWIGDNTLSGFAEQLAAFGPSIVAYAETVKDIKPEAVEGSVAAATMLSDLAGKLENTGGLVSVFTGDDDLGTFGTTLNTFGFGMSQYYNYIKDINVETLERVNGCIQELIDLSDSIKTKGGLNEAGFETIKTMISSFGDIISSSTSFLGAADKMEAMGSVIRAVGVLANSVATIGGDSDAIKTVGALSGGVKVLGQAFVDYWKDVDESTVATFNNAVTAIQTVAGIDSAALTAVNDALRNMLSWMNTLVSIDTEQMAAFSESLTTFATEGISAFTAAFSSSGEIANCVTKFVQQVCAQLKNKSSMFMTPGDAAGRAYLEAIKVTATAQGPIAAIDVVNAIVNAINALEQQFTQAGIDSATAFIKGFESQEDKARAAGEKIGNTILEALKNLADEFKTAGINCVQGFANGLADSEALKAVAANAAALGAQAVQATKDATAQASPSKKFIQLGRMCGIGFAIGLDKMGDAVAEASANLGTSSVTSLNDAIKSIYSLVNDYMDFDPTIRPDVDMSNIRRATDETTRLFNQAIGKSALNAEIASASIISQRPTRTAEEIQNGITGTGNTYYSFVQNNNSPKPLSRLEIYRDTRSLLKQVEGI